jgi:hypothetical protein
MDDLMQMIQDKDRLIRELLKELVHYKDSVAAVEAEMLSQQATIIEQRAELGESVSFKHCRYYDVGLCSYTERGLECSKRKTSPQQNCPLLNSE